MGSLRSRLLLATGVVIAVGSIASSVVLYLLFRSALYADFDTRLLDTAKAIAAMTEETTLGIEFDFKELGSQEFSRETASAYYQLWLDNGSVLDRSERLVHADLARFDGPIRQVGFRTVVLPDGRPGRQIGLCFHPKVDLEEEQQEVPDNKDEEEVFSEATVSLVVARGTEPIGSSLSRLSGLLTVVGLLATATCLGMLWLAVRQCLLPLHRIAGQIARIDQRKLDTRIATRQSPSEIRPVVERLNALLAHLEEAFRRERTFSADVAHELRTPLSGLQSTIEVCLSKPREPVEYREALDACLRICRQSHRMVEMLLELARIESGRVETRSEPVDLAQVIEQCWKPLAAPADAKQLRLHWEVADAAVVVSDRDKLAAVIRNLLENAVTHSDHGGWIHVHADTHDGGCQLRVENSTSQVSAEDLNHVFERFWRGDASRSETGHHFGLGLPLAARLTELAGGTIRADCEGNAFRVTLTLPTIPVSLVSAS